VKIADDRDTDSTLGQAFDNPRESRGSLFIVHRDTDDLRARQGQRRNLFDGACNISRIGVGHRLHNDLNLRAYANLPNPDRTRFPALNLRHAFSLPAQAAEQSLKKPLQRLWLDQPNACQPSASLFNAMQESRTAPLNLTPSRGKIEILRSMPVQRLHGHFDHGKQYADGRQKALSTLPVLLVPLHTPLQICHAATVAVTHQTGHLRLSTLKSLSTCASNSFIIRILWAPFVYR
jgi:hypothetical protein